MNKCWRKDTIIPNMRYIYFIPNRRIKSMRYIYYTSKTKLKKWIHRHQGSALSLPWANMRGFYDRYFRGLVTVKVGSASELVIVWQILDRTNGWDCNVLRILSPKHSLLSPFSFKLCIDKDKQDERERER